MSLVLALLGTLRAALRTHTDLALENLALRQQLALLRRRSKRPQFALLDRLLWVWLSNQWAGWDLVTGPIVLDSAAVTSRAHDPDCHRWVVHIGAFDARLRRIEFWPTTGSHLT